MEGLAGQYQAASAGTALSYLGRQALIESDTTTLNNGAASWGYTLAGAAESVELTVKDARGRVVYEGDRRARRWKPHVQLEWS